MPKFKIDRKARAAIGRAAIPYFRKADCNKLMAEIAEILAERNPDYRVECFHVDHAPDLASGLIRVGVVVDGDMKSGLFLRPGDKPR